MSDEFGRGQKDEVQTLTEVVERNDKAAAELQTAVNGTLRLEDGRAKDYAIGTLVDKVTATLAVLGYQVKAVPKPKATGAKRGPKAREGKA